MIHKMRLQEKYFNLTKYNNKVIEIRLFDKKRKLLKKGDSITFYKLPHNDESLTVTIDEITLYNSFNELIDNYNETDLGINNSDKQELVNDLKKIYSTKDEKAYGVMAIRFHI